jgi:hypothetical protein
MITEMDEQQSKSMSERAGVIVDRIAKKVPFFWDVAKIIAIILIGALVAAVIAIVLLVWPYVAAPPLIFVGILLDIWNDATVKGLLVVIVVQGFIIISEIRRIRVDMIEARTPRCQQCGGDFTADLPG